MMTRRDDLRKRDHTSPELPRLNYDIQNRIYAHKRQKYRDFVETLDQNTDVTKLWRTIKGIYGRAKREAENEAITFNRFSFSLSKQLATKFNQQFNTLKLGRRTSSSEARLVTKETKSLEMAQTFTTDLVRRAIKNCRNSKAFGFRPDHSTTPALLHMTTDNAMGSNQRKPPKLTICVAVDLSAAFDTVCHNNLLSKITRSQRDGCHVI